MVTILNTKKGKAKYKNANHKELKKYFSNNFEFRIGESETDNLILEQIFTPHKKSNEFQSNHFVKIEQELDFLEKANKNSQRLSQCEIESFYINSDKNDE